ncbi:hypothetical protein RIF29_15592 [Crotalaria pallida]|uniref:H(+)-exporting diphosphatase n=1 Tax=Crotalaria pallida TaxID=3830 RepID=A0AAN9FJD0_CROPI
MFAYALSLIFLIIFTLAAIAGCVILYTGQGKLYGTTSETLDYVVNQAQFTTEKLRNVSHYFNTSEQVALWTDEAVLPKVVQKSIDQIETKITAVATNVIFGLALGYKSVIIPIFAIVVSIFVSFSLASMYGIIVAALGMLSTIAVGNTTAVIEKGFVIGSTALVSLALFGAFVRRFGIIIVDVLTPKVFIGLIISVMLPYWFSALSMKSAGSAALKMVEEVRRQFNSIPGLMKGTTKPDYATILNILIELMAVESLVFALNGTSLLYHDLEDKVIFNGGELDKLKASVAKIWEWLLQFGKDRVHEEEEEEEEEEEKLRKKKQKNIRGFE